MGELERDFDDLLGDYDLVLRLEEGQLSRSNPVVEYLQQKWCIEDDELEEVGVAQEGHISDALSFAGNVSGRAAKGAVKGAVQLVKMSPALVKRFSLFAAEKTKQFNDKRVELTGKAVILDRKAKKLKHDLEGVREFSKHEVFTGSWTSKVCQEDEVSLSDCIGYDKRLGSLDDIVKKYTMYTRSVLGKSRKEGEDGLERIGKSTAWALKRSAGIMGILDPLSTVEAWPLPGNVIVVRRGKSEPGRVQSAIARDGSYGEKIPQMTVKEANDALDTVIGLAAFLQNSGARAKVFGYKGISDELESMKRNLKDLDGKELKEATIRYNNAVVINDAIITSVVRVAEGLLAYVKASKNNKA